MTAVEEALAGEERLLGEIKSAQGKSDERRAEVNRLSARRGEVVKELAGLYRADARGDEQAGERISELQAEQEQLTRQIEQAEAAYKGAVAGRRDAEEELTRFRDANLAALAEEADSFTQDAREAFAALEAPYQEAEAKWTAAEGRWARLSEALRKELVAAREAAGIHSSGRTDGERSRVPQFPVSVPSHAFERARAGRLLARPAAIQAIEQDEDPTES